MANGNKTVKNRTEKTVVDLQTGEAVSQETTTTFKVSSEPDFVKVYVEPLADLVKLKGHHLMLLFQLARKLTYEGVVYLTPGGRIRIGEAIGIQPQTFRNYLNDLLEFDVIRRTGHSEFMVNPTIIARGQYQEIEARQQTYYKIERVKTKKGREPKPKEDGAAT